MTAVAYNGIRRLAQQLLVQAATDAGTSVFLGRVWPMTTDMFPALLVWSPEDRKTSMGRNMKGGFTSTCTLVVRARITAGNPELVEAALDSITGQILEALVLPLLAYDGVQQITEISTESQVNATTAQLIGEAAIALSIEYVEWFEPVGVPLQDIRGTVTDGETGQTYTLFDAALPPFPAPGA